MYFYKVHDRVRAHGVSGLARRSIAYAIAYIYRRGVRPCLPFGEPVHYAGIPICQDRKWGDRTVPTSWVPGEALDQPDYEATLVAGLCETIRPGDSVVVVGVGFGVTAVVAALRTGPSGTVQCFEGSKQYVRLAQQTAARNRVTNVSIHHAVVAKPISVYGVGSDVGAVLPPSQLPPCDVLELDCEGAEVEILRELSIQPRVILVETHGLYGASTHLVASLLEKRGYIISDRGVAEPRAARHCTLHDIRVLLGIKLHAS
jgi:protein-L-isoaspartate O-methyltransferase